MFFGTKERGFKLKFLKNIEIREESQFESKLIFSRSKKYKVQYSM